MINIIITGAAGRMGKTLVKLISRSADLKLIGAIDSPANPKLGKDAGDVAEISSIGIPLTDNLQETIPDGDVVIDFSAASATQDILKTVCAAQKAMVIGTTGHGPDQRESLKAAAKTIPLLISPNMSIGVNLLWKLTEITSKTLDKNYTISIVERHHVHKKDAPSGTAKKLIEIVAANGGYNIEEDIHYRENKDTTATCKPISVQSIREGEVVGEHTVSYTSKGEKIELAHHAFTREIFAEGALRAARWIVDKPAGLYDMQDVLFDI